jgi:hypothetical protein
MHILDVSKMVDLGANNAKRHLIHKNVVSDDIVFLVAIFFNQLKLIEI